MHLYCMIYIVWMLSRLPMTIREYKMFIVHIAQIQIMRSIRTRYTCCTCDPYRRGVLSTCVCYVRIRTRCAHHNVQKRTVLRTFGGYLRIATYVWYLSYTCISTTKSCTPYSRHFFSTCTLARLFYCLVCWSLVTHYK